ncbi:MAG: hypothetical protein ACRDHP_16950, partial [Ktedonobacterales bacterium]
MTNSASNAPESQVEETPEEQDERAGLETTLPGTIPGQTAVPPALSGSAMLRRGFARWAFMGGVRLIYRRWTR